MALDFNVNNNVINNPSTTGAVREGSVNAVSEAAKKAVEAMGDVNAKEPVDTKPAEKTAEEENVAIKDTSELGDELRVTVEGALSSQAGGTVLTSDEDGLVAEQNKVSIEANEDAMKSMRAQIQETRDKQAKAMERMRETAEANAERAAERNELRDADNDASKARKDLIIEEAEQNGNSVVETAKEHVDNLTGLTQSQVEQLYRDGRISRYEYQQNMESREATEEQSAAAANETSQLVKETLANEAVTAASEALVTAVDNGNSAVMEAALGLGKSDEAATVRAVTG